MELHFWLIPLLLVAAALLTIFYLIVKYTGGSGVRTEGRTLLHKPDDEDSSG
jgi:hypothetical protein